MASFTISSNLEFTLQVLDRVPEQGLVDDGPIGMNSDMGLVQLAFRQTLGDQAWIDKEIMVVADTLLIWVNSVEEMVEEGKHQHSGWDSLATPHCLLYVCRQGSAYNFFAGLSAGYLTDSGGDWEANVGSFWMVDGETLLRFAHALRAELDAVTNIANR